LQADLAPEVLAYLKRAVSILLFVMAASLLAALFVSRKLQHFISDPLRGLVASTQELAGGNLNVRVAAARTDEFGELARAFNEMAGSLQQSHAEILDYQQTLEQRVKDRTIELEKEIAERKQAETALAESESKYRVLIEQSADGIIVSDEQWNIRLANPAICRMLGYTSEELCQRNIAETYIPEERHLLALRRWEWRGGSILNYERNMRKKDGSCFPVELSLSSVQTKGGWLAVGVFRDITERKRVAAELENTHKQLLGVSRQAGMAEVATNVLHNVGNVLNSVNVSTALVSEKVRESRVSSLAKVVALMRAHQNDLATFLTQDPKGMQLCDYLDSLAQYLGKEQTGILKELESLNGNIEHIKEIVTMQQSYARAAGVVETLPIVDLVEDALRMNNGALARHEVQVVREYVATPSVPVDKHKVLQILVNLVRNAKYALDESGRKDKLLTVRVATDTDSFVTISVIDNGVGIPPENLTRIFSYGFTTRKDGHGFGLHSGALAAKEMGGSLRAYSDGPGQGAKFTLSLPLHQEHENV
jgi:PAS domain S-box-containing protein